MDAFHRENIGRSIRRTGVRVRVYRLLASLSVQKYIILCCCTHYTTLSTERNEIGEIEHLNTNRLLFALKCTSKIDDSKIECDRTWKKMQKQNTKSVRIVGKAIILGQNVALASRSKREREREIEKQNKVLHVSIDEDKHFISKIVILDLAVFR